MAKSKKFIYLILIVIGIVILATIIESIVYGNTKGYVIQNILEGLIFIIGAYVGKKLYSTKTEKLKDETPTD